MLLGDVLAAKGTEVFRVSPETRLLDAVAVLNEHKIGALLVVGDAGALEGIVTERDVLRACHQRFEELVGLGVADVMTTELVIGEVHDSIDYAMRVMNKRSIRHLPVFDAMRLVGVVSIVDLVRAQ